MKRGHRDVAEGNQTLGIVSPWNVITPQRLLHHNKAVLQGFWCFQLTRFSVGSCDLHKKGFTRLKRDHKMVWRAIKHWPLYPHGLFQHSKGCCIRTRQSFKGFGVSDVTRGRFTVNSCDLHEKGCTRVKRGHRDVAEGNQTLGIVSPWNVITLQRLLHQRQGSPSRASVSSDVTRDRRQF